MISLALPTLFTPLAFLIILAALAANNNQKASGVKRVGNARLINDVIRHFLFIVMLLSAPFHLRRC